MNKFFAATLVLPLITGSALSTAATEEETNTNTAEAPEVIEEPNWTGNIEAGYVRTTGNTEEKNVKSRAEINYEASRWRNRLYYDSLNNSADGERTAEKYFLSDRLAYLFNAHDYAFLFGSYEDDRFSGFDYQATVSGGYGRRLIHRKDMEWDIEVGPGYRYSKSDDPNDRTQEELIGRAYTIFTWKFSDTSTFEQELSSEFGDENTISKSISSLRVGIIGNLALKLSYTYKYTEEVPADKDNTDTETAATLSYTF